MNLLFDLDGTLTDPALGISRCFVHACFSVGVARPSDEQLRDCIGPPIQDSLRTLLGTEDPLLLDVALVSYRERFASLGMFENAVYPQIPDALAALRSAGNRLWVATSKPHVFANQIIDHFELRSFFEKVYGAELDGTRADKSALIKHLLEQESLHAAETVMIGDRKHDVVGARANGLRTIGVSWGYGSGAELRAATPDAIVDSPSELVALLKTGWR